MKNSSNLAFIILILMILGCSCPKNEDSSKQSKSKTPSSEKIKTDDSPISESPTSDDAISLGKYNRIEYGMEYPEVVNIIGSDGKIIKVSPDGTIRYLWGDDTKFIMITFMNDKVEIKSQNGLD